jgi:hypothetical protein
VNSARNALGVVTHVIERDADGAVQALAHHAQGVANQNTFHASGVGYGGKGRVIRGHDGYFFTTAVHL